MAELITSPFFIAGLFFLIAFAYSSVGLGGGSSYTALMAILGFNVLAIPLLSLTLNMVVTSVGSYQFIRNKHAKIRLILPFLVSSIPMAYVGGALDVPKELFYWALLISLIIVVMRIYFWSDTAIKLNIGTTGKNILSVISGSILGLVAGVVGIGGGIYLVPLIIVLGLGTAKEAAACGAIFIWLNSFSGLVARLQYNSIDIIHYLSLIIAVLVGGVLGSFLGARRFQPHVMEKILGVIILIAIVLLSRKLILI